MAEDFYRNIINSYDEAFCIIDVIFDDAGNPVDWRYLDANPQFMEQAMRPEVVGHTASEIFPDTEPYLLNFFGKVALSGISAHMENKHKVLNQWYDVSAYKIGVTESRQVAVLIHDITQRKLMEESLKASEQKIRMATQAAGIYTWELDVATGKIRFSGNVKDVIGFSYTGDDDIFSRIGRFTVPEEREQRKEALLRTMRGEGDLHSVNRVINPDTGQIVWLETHATLVTEDDGTQQRVVGIVRNITARKRSEEALRESEQRAQELIAQLVESDKNKNQFIRVLSHELRNPLAVIVASLSLLEITQNPDMVSRAKESLKRQAGHLTKLVDDLLDLTRINQKKIKLKIEDVDLSELLKNASLDMISAYKKKGVRLDVKLPTAPLFLSADPVRIVQCVGNLLQNALKFTPATGEVILSLEKENEEVVIRVQDNGIGIRPELLEHIFEAFTQADTSLARTDSGGLGLGLSIVDGIVRLHNGSVTAFSEGDGKGSLFTIKLPVLTQPADTKHPAAVNKQARNFRILVIDDNKDLTDILCTVLESMGHQVRAAYNGTDGITEAKEIRPDVIFCDIGLPDMNGYEVAKVLKSDPVLKDTLLVALTGYAGEDDVKTANAAGFDRHLKKPVDMAALEKILTEIENKT